MEKNLIKIRNVLRFSLLFSAHGGSPINMHLPDYVLEKYKLLIGFNPIYDGKFPEVYQKSVLENINEYIDRWGIDSLNKIYPQILFISSVNSDFSFPNILINFEYFIGDIKNVSDVNYNLHNTLENFISKYMSENKEDITKLKRDLKISDIVK